MAAREPEHELTGREMRRDENNLIYRHQTRSIDPCDIDHLGSGTSPCCARAAASGSTEEDRLARALSRDLHGNTQGHASCEGGRKRAGAARAEGSADSDQNSERN